MTTSAAPRLPIEQSNVEVLQFPGNAYRASITPDAVLVIVVVGVLHQLNRTAFRQLVEDALHAGRRRFVFDLEECPYIDSSGFGVLVSLSRQVRTAGGGLVLAALQPDVQTLFELTRMTDLFTIEAHVMDALAGFES